jgi:hypothetical protein
MGCELQMDDVIKKLIVLQNILVILADINTNNYVRIYQIEFY